MILLLLSLAFASCDKQLSHPFTEVRVAKAIGELGPDGRVFSAIIRGFSYDAIAKHFGIPVERVVAIGREGADIVFRLRDEEEKESTHDRHDH